MLLLSDLRIAQRYKLFADYFHAALRLRSTVLRSAHGYLLDTWDISWVDRWLICSIDDVYLLWRNSWMMLCCCQGLQTPSMPILQLDTAPRRLTRRDILWCWLLHPRILLWQIQLVFRRRGLWSNHRNLLGCIGCIRVYHFLKVQLSLQHEDKSVNKIAIS